MECAMQSQHNGVAVGRGGGRDEVRSSPVSSLLQDFFFSFEESVCCSSCALLGLTTRPVDHKNEKKNKTKIFFIFFFFFFFFVFFLFLWSGGWRASSFGRPAGTGTHTFRISRHTHTRVERRAKREYKNQKKRDG